YFRNYPKDLPGAKLKRTLARTHTGKGGVALTAAAGLASGATAVHLNQQREKVKKAWTQAPAAPKPQLPKLPTTPKSPVAAVARPKVARPVQPTQRKEPEKPKVKQTGVGMNINKSMPDASAVHILGTIKRKKKKGKVSKSFVPGKGWVSATSVPKKVLRGASGKNTHAKMRQVSPEDQNFKGLNRAARQAYGDNKSPKRVEQQLFDSEIDYKVSRGKNARRAPIKRIDADTDIGGGIAAFAAQTGGRRGQRYMVVGQAGKSDWGKKV